MGNIYLNASKGGYEEPTIISVTTELLGDVYRILRGEDGEIIPEPCGYSFSLNERGNRHCITLKWDSVVAQKTTKGPHGSEFNICISYPITRTTGSIQKPSLEALANILSTAFVRIYFGDHENRQIISECGDNTVFFDECNVPGQTASRVVGVSRYGDTVLSKVELIELAREKPEITVYENGVFNRYLHLEYRRGGKKPIFVFIEAPEWYISRLISEDRHVPCVQFYVKNILLEAAVQKFMVEIGDTITAGTWGILGGLGISPERKPLLFNYYEFSNIEIESLIEVVEKTLEVLKGSTLEITNDALFFKNHKNGGCVSTRTVLEKDVHLRMDVDNEEYTYAVPRNCRGIPNISSEDLVDVLSDADEDDCSTTVDSLSTILRFFIENLKS